MKIYFAFFLAFSILNLTITEAWADNSLRSPNISGNALFLYRNSNFSQDDGTTNNRNGLDLQEAELAFYADVDPYSRLNMLLTVHPDYQRDATTGKITQSWKVEPEELFAESNELPMTTLKVGKFKAAFGKHNLLHDHAFPFVDAPVANSILLGDEGLNDVGVSAAILLPISWYSEFTVQFLRGEGENAEFSSPTPGDGVGLGHWKNLLNLTDALTLEVGASYAQGSNFLRTQTKVEGLDLTFKWRPSEGGKYNSWIFGGEYLERNLGQPGTANENGKGGYVWMQYQFAERWAAKVRYDHLDVRDADSTANPSALTNQTTDKYTAGFDFIASEFSSYRLEYSRAQGPISLTNESTENKVYLQANFTIGAHPAHGY